MNWLNKLERKFGKYAIKNLSAWLIACYAIGYMLSFFSLSNPNGSILGYLTLEPFLILKGQVWRLITWIFLPPSSFGIFTFVMLFFYYSIGTTLERTWGAFRYNVYIFSGILATIIGAFLLFLIYSALGISSIIGIGGNFTTYYINLSIFLAFAACYPNMQVMLYFIIPLKIKWIAYFDVAFLALSFLTSGWSGKVAIAASILNFIVFFFTTRNYQRVSPREIHRKQVYKQQMKPKKGVTKHKCTVCGRTEESAPELEFRFCSKCDGNYEYCQDHLFTHEHVHRG